MFTNLAFFIPILSILIAAGGLFFEIRRFNLEKENEKFASIKEALLTIQSKLENLSSRITRKNNAFNLYDLSLKIAFRVSEKLSPYLTKENIVDLANSTDKLIPLETSITYELINIQDQLTIKNKIYEDIDELIIITFKKQSDIPTTMTIINKCLELLSQAILVYTNLLFRYPNGKRPLLDYLEELVNSSKNNSLSQSDIEQEIKRQLLGILEDNLDGSLVPFIESIKEMINILVELVTQKNNKYLKKFIEWDKQVFCQNKQDQETIINLVDNWMLYEDEKRKNPEFKFELGCVLVRRILNSVAETNDSIEVLERLINNYPKNLSYSVGSSERDNKRGHP